MTTFLLEEEKLAVCFQGYPVLYNKAELFFTTKMKKKVLEAQLQMSYNEFHGREQNWHCVESVQIRVLSCPCFPVFSPNRGKYVPEITPYLDTFHAVWHSSH